MTEKHSIAMKGAIEALTPWECAPSCDETQCQAINAALQLLRDAGDGWEPSELAEKNRTYRMAYVPERRMSFQVVWNEEMGVWTTGSTVCFHPEQVTYMQPLPLPPQQQPEAK